MRRLLCVLLLVWPAAVDAQVPPSAEDIAGYAGLHAAAARGDVMAIAVGLATGANPNARDLAGRTPLHVAVFAGKHAVARALLAGRANPNALERQRYDPVTIAAVRDDVEMLRLLLERGANPAAVTSPYEGTALIAAAHAGHVEVVRALIAAKAPLDHVNNLGWTALLEAVILGDGGPRHTEIVRALVAAGANVNLADRQGASPLAHARRRGFAEMIRILESAGGRE
jgi:ankyrin repeat protein